MARKGPKRIGDGLTMHRMTFPPESGDLRGLPQFSNWPAVYVLNNDDDVYVGESLNVESRLGAHSKNPAKKHLKSTKVIIDEQFNKSVCLDLESLLIQLFAGEAKYDVPNRNSGITDAEYFDRARYKDRFTQIFDALRKEGLFDQDLVTIRNSDLYKFSPFKSLNEKQEHAVEMLLRALSDAESHERQFRAVVQGAAGTGKTVVLVFLLKFLADLGNGADISTPEIEDDTVFPWRTADAYSNLESLRLGLVVPQQSLRTTLKRVFALTPGLKDVPVLDPWQVGQSDEKFDLLVVDEGHRLSRRANQSSAKRNTDFREISEKLYGEYTDDVTQYDWIKTKSRHSVVVVDPFQSVRTADLGAEYVQQLVSEEQETSAVYTLEQQMRMANSDQYLPFLRALLSDTPVMPQETPDFGEYRFELFPDFGAMQDEILRLNADVGLSRTVAGYAWEWTTRGKKKDPTAYDIELDGRRLRWNSVAEDWINHPGSEREMGSIHTVQGYDLNYCGVVFGSEISYDPATGQVVIHRENYKDRKGKEGRGETRLSDEDLRKYIVNIYLVLMSRGIRGTFVYCVDPGLRELFARYLPISG